MSPSVGSPAIRRLRLASSASLASRLARIPAPCGPGMGGERSCYLATRTEICGGISARHVHVLVTIRTHLFRGLCVGQNRTRSRGAHLCNPCGPPLLSVRCETAVTRRRSV
jgi:hypothetical protein